MKTATRVALNSFSNIASSAGGNIISLVTLPTFIAAYGVEGYGIFIFATGLATTLSYFDMGINTSLTKFTAEYLIDRDKRRFSTAIYGSILIALALGLLFGGVLLAASFFTGRLLNLDGELLTDSRIVFQIAAAFSFLFVPSRIAQSILEGHQMFYWRNISNLSKNVVTLGLFAAILLGFAPSLVLFSGIVMLGRLLPALINTIFINRFKLLDGIVIKTVSLKEIFRTEFMSYSGNLFLLQLTSILTFQVDKLVVGSMLGSSMVTIHSVVTKPMFIIRMISNQTLLVFGPLFAQKNKIGDFTVVDTIIGRGNLLLSIAVIPIIALNFMLIKPFINIYVGEPFTEYAYWGGIASLIFLTAPFSGLVSRLLVFTGHVREIRNVNIVLAILNLALSAYTTLHFGIGGVIIGSIAQSLLTVPIYNYILGRSRAVHWPQLYPPAMFANIAYVAVASVVVNMYLSRLEITTWLQLFTTCVVAAIILMGPGVLVAWRMKLWKKPNLKQAVNASADGPTSK